MFNIFQSPWPLLVTAVITWMALVILSQSRYEIRRLWQLLIPLAIALAAFGIERLVMTDREKIEDIIVSAKSAAINRQPQVFDLLLSDDYSDILHESKEQMMMFCNRKFSREIAENIITQFSNITINSPTATGNFGFIITLDKDSPYAVIAGVMSVKATIYFEKAENGNWYIKSSDVTELNKQPVSWKQVK